MFKTIIVLNTNLGESPSVLEYVESCLVPCSQSFPFQKLYGAHPGRLRLWGGPEAPLGPDAPLCPERKVVVRVALVKWALNQSSLAEQLHHFQC